MNERLPIVLAATCFSTIASFAAKPHLPDGIRHIETVGGIESYEVESNGLRVLLGPNEVLPVAAVMMTYEAGGRHEVIGTTGTAHILEHMMFKGTRDHKGDTGYSQTMARLGARVNATTYYDRTNYYAVLPREHVERAIALEADRMRNLRITPEALESELTVVLNEYERGENNPTRTLFKEMYAAAFTAHPYGQPVIGWKSDIQRTSVEQLRDFYDTFYWPENATLTVIGGFDKEATLAAIRKHCTFLPKAPGKPPADATAEPKQLGPRHTTVERTGEVGVVAIGYKAPAGIHEDWAALRLLGHILGADKTGRLYRTLDDKGKASSTFVFAPQLRDPSLFFLGAFLTPDTTHDEVERILLEEVERIGRGHVTDEELARAKSTLEAETIYGRDGPYAIAQEINEHIAIGDWKGYVALPQAIRETTAEDIRRVAETYLKPNGSTVGRYVPIEPEIATDSFSQINGPLYFREPESFDPPDPMTVRRSETRTEQNVPAVRFGERIRQTEVNGIEVVAINLPVEKAVAFVGSFAAGTVQASSDRPALARLTAAMSDKGTQWQNRFSIAEQLDALGASIAFDADAHSLTFSGKFLREDAGVVINLLAEQLKEPVFDFEVLETVKKRHKAEWLQALHNPDYRATAEIRRRLYPEGHPNHEPSIQTLLADLDTTTIQDIENFHRKHYGPESMRLVFAGDIDFDHLVAAVESAFADWEGGVPYPTEKVRTIPPEASVAKIVMEDKPSVSACFGQFTGLRRTDKAYLAFHVGNHILGGHFHSRLMSEIRERQGFTYHITSRHGGDLLTSGHWSVNGSFAPSRLEKGLRDTEAVIREWYEKGVSEKEVGDAIAMLRGTYLVGLSTTSAVAGQVHSFMRRGFAADHIDAYPHLLGQITPKEVNAAIHQYFDPAKLTRVVVGSFQKSEESGSPEVPASSKRTREIGIRLDVPDTAWRIRIDEIYRTDDSIVVLSKLNRNDDAGTAQVISTVSDHVSIPVEDEKDRDLPVRYYVVGKTWSWGHVPDYEFLRSIDDFDNVIDRAERLQHSP